MLCQIRYTLRRGHHPVVGAAADQSDLDTGYADSSSRADDGERHSGQYIGLTNGYEQIIDHLVEQIGKTQTRSISEVIEVEEHNDRNPSLNPLLQRPTPQRTNKNN